MSRLKEYFARLRAPKMEEISFGPISVQVDKKTFSELIRLGDVEDTKRNLQLAEEKGCKPLSLSDIIAQTNPYDLRYAVLFDTPPVIGFTGNHWRVLWSDGEAAGLQHCNHSGTIDNKEIPPITLPLETPLFTGLSLQEYTIKGDSRATLSQVVDAYKCIPLLGCLLMSELGVLPRHHKNTIYWSGENGTLATSEEQEISSTNGSL